MTKITESYPGTFQVAAQLHALLQEKALLASENERLLRENCGLQVHTVLTQFSADSLHHVNLPDCHASNGHTPETTTQNMLFG